MVSVGTHRLHVMTAGEGRPPVVIDVGFGDSPANWQAVVERLAERTQVVTYERAGYGRSEPGPLPRTPDRAVDELAAALKGAGIEPPYLFVGHSLGGLNMLLMGARHPELSAALVLVDPPPIAFLAGEKFPELRADAESTTVRLGRDADAAASSSDPTVAAQAPRLRMLASEHAEMFSADAGGVAEIDSLGELPVTVIAAGNANPEFGSVAFTFQEFWIDENTRVAEMSKRPRLRIARSGHYVYREAPNVVVEEIAAMVDSVRAEMNNRKKK
jgi:pimeloyl-ACP methyl ester carboxylesterase